MREGIEPDQVRKSSEISIGRTQGESVLDGERCKMRIRHEVPISAGQRQKFAENRGMALRRLRYPGRLRGEPVRHLLPCDGRRRGSLEAFAFEMRRRFGDIVEIDERLAHIGRPGAQRLAPSRSFAHGPEATTQCFVDKFLNFKSCSPRRRLICAATSSSRVSVVPMHQDI